MKEQPIDPTKPLVNHDRSGLWAPDPLDEFSSEPASINPATRLPAPHKRVSVRPAVRRQDGHRARLAVAEPVPAASTSKERRGLWSFASGSAFGALMCVILVSWLTTSELPRAEPFVRGPEPVSPAPAPVAPAPVPVAPAASEPPPAQRSIPLSRERPDRPSTAAKTSSATDTKKASFVGGLWIDSTPQGARVLIDRNAAGFTPLVVPDLGAGSHAVRVEADGHLPWSSSVRIITGRQTRVHTTLAPLDSALVRR